MASTHFLDTSGLGYLWNKIKSYVNANKGVGEDVSGQTFTVDGVQVTAGDGAERFNDYTNNIATGNYSHAEGYLTKATGVNSHAEGSQTTASGSRAHAEGINTIASGTNSHAEGASTVASKTASHAEGMATIAGSANQHVQGKYNIEDAQGTYAHIVGNGTSSARANIHTLDWNGAAWYKGGVKVGGTSAADATELTPGIEIFTITVTMTSTEPPTCTMDKTYAEVLAAYNNGDILELNLDGQIIPLQFTQLLNDNLIFQFSNYNVYIDQAAQAIIYSLSFLIDSQSIHIVLNGEIPIPSKTSDLTNDAGFLTSYTETDPTVPSWAKQPTKPTYTASEVGALPLTTVIPSKTSDLTNDSGFLTSHQPVVQTLTSGTAIGSVGGTVLYAPPSTPEIFIGSTTPSGYTMWIDPEGMLVDANEVEY